MGILKVSSIFENCQFVADFAASLSLTFKGKQEIRQKIVENGGTLSHVLSKQVQVIPPMRVEVPCHVGNTLYI